MMFFCVCCCVRCRGYLCVPRPLSSLSPPAVDSVVVLEGTGVRGHVDYPSDCPEAEKFEAMPSEPIYIAADKFTKALPPRTLSRVSSTLQTG